ncbi:nucleoporin protein Ndc1-Nup protein [Thalictrum thalictroides]|uniref:Nucleoporin protein Ndc1-Nup protein n=1 Tax=Thalictrum thalictroides TaxID=46969 RepID=A0A7J6VMV8_THATH|nr:nucleoporin protein Ndc1-Nup protein [Thalictrum thalictroides]
MPSSSSSSEIINNRFLGFLIWQLIHPTIIYLIYKTLLSPFTSHFFSFSLLTPFFFFIFHSSLLLFSYTLSTISSPQVTQAASLSEIASSIVRFFINSVIGSSSPNQSTPSFRSGVRTSLGFILFVISSAISGSIAVVSLCRNSDLFSGFELIGLGFRGFVFGLIYGVHYVYLKRWVLSFPIIQRPRFFSFKMGLPSSARIALKLSSLSLLCSALVVVFLPNKYKSKGTIWKFIVEQGLFYIGSIAVSLCWELSHLLHQVLHTKRCVFAPPIGSAAAETNPSEPLLGALEESTPKSLLQYLAYLDLCMTCENNVDTWRRAAFFEETGETYRRVVSVCLRPLEQLTSKLCEGLEGSSKEKTDRFSHQLCSPTDLVNELKLNESFNEFQLCEWSARAVSALTARSHKDDRFGIAQLSGCNASVMSTLLSCLLAVEACMGKKTHLQAPQLMGPTSIKWATLNTGKRDGATASVGKRRGGPLHGKAYAMADVLRTSIYMIVSVFHNEMMGSTKAGILEKDWIVGSKPLYGTCDILVQKLSLFLDFRAS